MSDQGIKKPTNLPLTTFQPAHLRLDGVSKRFGAVGAVSRVTLEIPASSFTTLLGPSGCGKTTLLRMIAGFYELDEGGIYLDDKRVDDMPAHRRGTAMVFQDYALWPHMTVFENVAYGLEMNKLPRPEIVERVHEAMALVEMPAPEILTRKPTQLSGGQQQRVALARALIVRPRVLLLDEPLSNLDAKVRQRLRVEIRRLQRRIGITTIYVTHDQEEALSMSDTVVVMNQGHVMQVGRPEEVYRKPSTAFVAEFLGVSNVLKGIVDGDGHGVKVAGACIPYEGTPGAQVTVVFKADEAQLVTGPPPPGKGVTFFGRVEEVFFIGSVYRHYVNLNGEMVLVDSDQRCSETDVQLIVPGENIQIYPND